MGACRHPRSAWALFAFFALSPRRGSWLEGAGRRQTAQGEQAIHSSSKVATDPTRTKAFQVPPCFRSRLPNDYVHVGRGRRQEAGTPAPWSP